MQSTGANINYVSSIDDRLSRLPHPPHSRLIKHSKPSPQRSTSSLTSTVMFGCLLPEVQTGRSTRRHRVCPVPPGTKEAVQLTARSVEQWEVTKKSGEASETSVI
ncbi:unnamed protein product [Pleuronectes platessa]|uniref:Uncharacterized protein n=1 Tax=Pleuronectes platessa TaxID=8262 RepID=A0A9N7U516_PLEPL|nr:unnamed protein product [Pleuronectes platessa]